MANRSEESGREESTYGRSGNPQERQQLHEQDRPSQGYQQGQQYGRGQGIHQGGQGLGQQGAGGPLGEPGERLQSWESERGSDIHGGQGFGQRGQRIGQGSTGYGFGAQGQGQGNERYGQGFGQGSERYGQGGQGFGQGSERYGHSGQDYGQGGQQQDWQRGWQGEQFGLQGYGTGQEGRLVQGRQGLGDGSLAGGYGGMSGSYGGQQLGYGSGLGQRSFRGMGPKNYTRSDERIREDVCERLTQDDDLDASEIEVKAEHGVVMLEGTVEERWMKHRAEDIAESCSGVREVENRIRVESGAGARTGSESLGRRGSQAESRSQSSTLGGSGGTSGSTPH